MDEQMGSEIREVDTLQKQMGQAPFFLHDQQAYQILQEVEVDGKHYAIMQKKDDHPDDAYLFRIEEASPLEIEDENEWERVTDALDEVWYQQDLSENS
jgi:hypothetical protein